MKLSQFRGKDRRKIVIVRVIILLIVIFAILMIGRVFYKIISEKIESGAFSTAKEDSVREDEQNQNTGEDSQVADGEETDQQEEPVSEEGIHSYELIVSDVSWQDAFEDCIARGGYLVRINNREEWDYIIDMLNSQKGDACYFYLGGCRADNDTNYYWLNEEGELYGNALNGSDFWGSDLWLEGEPSYADGETEETNLAILYQKSAARYVLNDVGGNVLTDESYLAGKIAYICEYDD